MKFEQYLQQWVQEEAVSTEDVLAALLPLLREVIEAHRCGLVAPLEGLQDLNVETPRIWFEEAKRKPLRQNPAALARIERAARAAVEILSESRRTTDVGEGDERVVRADIGVRGDPVERHVYLPGYVAWEHELAHHDPLTDIFSLGMLLASIACQLNFNEPGDLEAFVTHRRNLFALNPGLHPVIAQIILRMTELDRHRRAQDLLSLLVALENYRDQPVAFELDLDRIPGFRTRDVQTRQQVVLARLRDRLFDISRRHSLLHFRPTMQNINLTQASIPLLLDIRNIREDQVFVWSDALHRQIIDGKPISLNKHLNFNEALYLQPLLERIISDSRRDQNEFGFVQLRLVLCFLTWANLKEKPVEHFVSPLVLLPVRLIKNKGIRDTFSLDPLTNEAEINPVVRHQFRQLYNIDLPETIDLAASGLESLFDFLTARIQASEPAVTLTRIDRPRIDLIHEKAKRRLDQYRRSAHVSGRGVRHFADLDYSYDPANYHPLGIKLFSAKVRTPSSHLREIIEQRPRPRSYAAGDAATDTVEREKSFFQLRDAVEQNPYLWNFDLCNLTLANFRYRKMSLVRDYEGILEGALTNPAFESTFSLTPRPVENGPLTAPPLAERFDVVPCDPTQATAIARARRGASYIIQGPPGTGKSQTITNLIADYVAQGKRVLFLCEKRAAIDVVYARLRQCGLAPLCSLIHDSQADKKAFILDLKQTYENWLSDVGQARAVRKNRRAALDRLESSLAPLETFANAMRSELPDIQLSRRQFVDRCIELEKIRPSLTPEVAERLPAYPEWWRHADKLHGLSAMLEDLAPDGIFAHHPLRRLSAAVTEAERPIELARLAAQAALLHLQRLTDLLESVQIPPDAWRSLSDVQQLLAYAHGASRLVGQGNLNLTQSTSAPSRQLDEALAQIRRAEATLAAAQTSTVAWRQKLPAAELINALDQARQWQVKRFAWLSPGWWHLRSVLRRHYDFAAHAVKPTWVQVLTNLQKEYDAQAALHESIESTKRTFGITDDPRQFHAFVLEFRRLVQSLPDGLARFHAALLESPAALATITLVLQAEQTAQQLATEAAKLLDQFEPLPLDELRQELVAVADHAYDIPQALSVLSELAQLPPSLAAAVRSLPFTLQQVEAASAHRTWQNLLRAERDINRFDGRLRTRCAAEVEAAYDAWLRSNAAEICDRVRNQFLDHVALSAQSAATLSPEQRNLKRRYAQGRRALEHEFGKSMRYRAIRELMDGDTAVVIRDLKPVWLMSPLSVSDTLPLATDLFDVVIFDEASQVPLEESVPSLYRGQQVIVVGDEMQLPPTDFFSARQQDDDDDLASDNEPQSSGYELDSDSLLNHAAKNLPSTMLGWHYRSRSESLISFSNWAFYDGRLLTVPDHRWLGTAANGSAPPQPAVSNDAAGTDLLLARPVSFHLLKHGVYDQRRNRAEADYIAQLVRELLVRRLNLSIGVIAFSEAQQGEIESALNRLAQDDDEFRALYEEELEREIDGQFVGLLVKNLENIQGDERDVVILSICYGPGPNGRMLMNFGPINKSGGEKRLNVAFSRAKQFMAVVSSIQHSAITNDYNDGANALKNYLRYAEAVSQGDLAASNRVLASVSPRRDAVARQDEQLDDVTGRQIAEALAEAGYVVDPLVGQSHFRLELAVRLPEDSAYRLGILVDTHDQYEQGDQLEREMMRPRLLRAFGWRVVKVLGKDWYDDRQRELDRLLEFLREPADERDPELEREKTSQELNEDLQEPSIE